MEDRIVDSENPSV